MYYHIFVFCDCDDDDDTVADTFCRLAAVDDTIANINDGVLLLLLMRLRSGVFCRAATATVAVANFAVRAVCYGV